MKRTSTRKAKKPAKTVLRHPDQEHARNAVLNSLSSVDAQRGYRHAIDEFVDWYCSEPRLAFKPNRRLAIAESLGISRSGARDGQPSIGSGEAAGLRGG